ncbi:MAG: type II toxin-antitoxin system VapC family toxin [Chitinophagales bacterium]
MNYLLDTNIIIIYSKNKEKSRRIETDYKIFAKENNLSISIVSVAEINSIIHQFQIGDKRRKGIDKILENVTRLDISYEEILKRYEDIDAFSQGRHRSKKSNFSAKNMGKNDLWIAATASAFNITLVTTDKDFDHLDGEFIDLKFIDIKDYS